MRTASIAPAASAASRSAKVATPRRDVVGPRARRLRGIDHRRQRHAGGFRDRLDVGDAHPPGADQGEAYLLAGARTSLWNAPDEPTAKAGGRVNMVA